MLQSLWSFTMDHYHYNGSIIQMYLGFRCRVLHTYIVVQKLNKELAEA